VIPKPYPSTTGSVLLVLAAVVFVAGVVLLAVLPRPLIGALIAFGGFGLIQTVNYRYARRSKT
jgi:hypothetical protein